MFHNQFTGRCWGSHFQMGLEQPWFPLGHSSARLGWGGVGGPGDNGKRGLFSQPRKPEKSAPLLSAASSSDGPRRDGAPRKEGGAWVRRRRKSSLCASHNLPPDAELSLSLVPTLGSCRGTPSLTGSPKALDFLPVLVWSCRPPCDRGAASRALEHCHPASGLASPVRLGPCWVSSERQGRRRDEDEFPDGARDALAGEPQLRPWNAAHRGPAAKGPRVEKSRARSRPWKLPCRSSPLVTSPPAGGDRGGESGWEERVSNIPFQISESENGNDQENCK
ncbi:PREDICTED: uncharacterized protein LOC106148852 [Chinchilla lanigera]|uniref:uncharacterized protein LOC106148852 n=1 Tax=Chinchilla lanigera TaxID=34839 RepID=UPI000697A25E|nr:PREDICTED: uncharacterized protein LOC106148852 [Chinchilla lanigera]